MSNFAKTASQVRRLRDPLRNRGGALGDPRAVGKQAGHFIERRKVDLVHACTGGPEAIDGLAEMLFLGRVAEGHQRGGIRYGDLEAGGRAEI